MKAREHRMTGVKRMSLGIIAGAALLLTGCSVNTVQPEFYTLSLDAKQERPVSLAETQTATVTVGLWPVHISDMLDRTGIISYGTGHEVRISEKHYWAGALDKSIERLLAAELIQTLGDEAVLIYPWGQQAKPDYQLRVRVVSLAGPLDGPVELIADWSLKPASGDQPLQSGRAQYVETLDSNEAGTYSAYVAAINRVVQRFSVDMAMLLKTIEQR